MVNTPCKDFHKYLIHLYLNYIIYYILYDIDIFIFFSIFNITDFSIIYSSIKEYIKIIR